MIPELTPEALARYRAMLQRETEIRAEAMRFYPHPTAKTIVASCDKGIKDILTNYPEAAL